MEQVPQQDFSHLKGLAHRARWTLDQLTCYDQALKDQEASFYKREEVRIEYYAKGTLKSISYLGESGLHHRENLPAYIMWHGSGHRQVECYYNQGLLHREDGPAHILHHDTGPRVEETYYINGCIHRLDGPAVREWYPTGELLCEKYIDGGKENMIMLPAVVTWYKNGKVKSEDYYTKGVIHREDGPASVRYHPTQGPLGMYAQKTWYKNGKMHRGNDAAQYNWNIRGYLGSIFFYREGVRHRVPSQGPACIIYNEEGDEISNKYFWHGLEVDKNFVPDEMKTRDGLGRIFL